MLEGVGTPLLEAGEGADPLCVSAVVTDEEAPPVEDDELFWLCCVLSLPASEATVPGGDRLYAAPPPTDEAVGDPVDLTFSLANAFIEGMSNKAFANAALPEEDACDPNEPCEGGDPDSDRADSRVSKAPPALKRPEKKPADPGKSSLPDPGA